MFSPLFRFGRGVELAGGRADQPHDIPQVDDDRGKGHDGKRPVDEGHVHVGSDGIGVQRLKHHGNAAEKQQHQSRKHEQGGDDVHGLARCPADHVDEHVHRDVLVPVKSFDAADERNVDEKEPGPFLTRRKARAEHVPQEGIEKHEADHPQENGGAKDFKGPFAFAFRGFFLADLLLGFGFLYTFRRHDRFVFTAHDVPLGVMVGPMRQTWA